jgi:hypothetical protein
MVQKRYWNYQRNVADSVLPDYFQHLLFFISRKLFFKISENMLKYVDIFFRVVFSLSALTNEFHIEKTVRLWNFFFLPPQVFPYFCSVMGCERVKEAFVGYENPQYCLHFGFSSKVSRHFFNTKMDSIKFSRSLGS